MAKTIAIISTLDTKGEETGFVRELIEGRGHKALVIDIGMGGEPLIPADITCDEIAELGGAHIGEVRASRERFKVTEIMTKGALAKIGELHQAGKLDGVIAMGGASNSAIAAAIMRSLPFGVPKFLVSSVAAIPSVSGGYFGTSDLAMMSSVVDVAGLNPLLENVLSHAVGAICGMVEMKTPASVAGKGKLVAVTEYGFTEQCARYVKKALQERGYQPIAFSATGIGEQAMEDLIEQGFFHAVIDLCPSSISHGIFGGHRIAGPRRLEVAGEEGLPQVIAPGGVNTFGRSWDKFTSELKQRKHYPIDQRGATIRMTAEELRSVVPVYAAKLNKARGPVRLLIPLRGWSSIDREGSPIYEPETDRVFVQELRRLLKPEIEIREVDANIEDIAFAQAVVAAFEEVVSAPK